MSIEEIVILIDEIKPSVEVYRGYGPIVEGIISDLGNIQDNLKKGNIPDAKELAAGIYGIIGQYREYIYDLWVKFEKIKAKIDALK
ncbi:hypothetical protein FJY84_03590 [Candidatus Bathyarchaeota archaeon]|nr:hypothetical protein [Candidatus Bathyarchaeota archaeon]